MLKNKQIESRPRIFGKSTLVTNAFLASCEANEGVEYRHPKYVCMSLKRYNEIVSQTKKELMEEIRKMRRIMVNPVPESDEVFGYNSALNDVIKSLETETKQK